jgi:hypothetical protein
VTDPDGEEIADNAAGRLLAILKRVHQANSSTLLGGAWASAFLLDAADLPALLRVIADVGDLVREVRGTIESLEDVTPEVILRHYGQIEQAYNISRNLEHSTGTFKQALQDTGWQCLEICDDLLSRRAPEPTIAETTVADLLKNTRGLLRQVLQSKDLPVDVKLEVHRDLVRIAYVLEQYWMFGTVRVAEELDAIASRLRRRPGLLTRIGESKSAEGFFRILVTLEAAIQLATGARALTAGHDEQPPARPPSPVVILAEEIGLSPTSLALEPPADETEKKPPKTGAT